MRQILIITAAALTLGACSTVGTSSTGSVITTAAQASEKAMIDCDDLYIAIADGVNTFEALPTTTAAQKVQAESVKSKAWDDLQAARDAYKLGQVVTTTALLADQAAASTFNAAPASPSPIG